MDRYEDLVREASGAVHTGWDFGWLAGRGRQLPDFDVHRYEEALRALDVRMRRDGKAVFRDHRFLIEARR